MVSLRIVYSIRRTNQSAMTSSAHTSQDLVIEILPLQLILNSSDLAIKLPYRIGPHTSHEPVNHNKPAWRA